MRITRENYKEVPIKQQPLLSALLDDVEEINKVSDYKKSIYIDWQDFHNEYSPERIDPCPDYYGYYSIRFCDSDSKIGEFMSIDVLDECLCLLYEYVI